MTWAQAIPQTDSKQAAERFVFGALRRIRIRSRVRKLAWKDGIIATPRRSVARELEELYPSDY